jgi:uncharacterized protein (DUF2249 family)
MPASTPSTVIDVRVVAGRERHPLIMSTFADLEPGQALELVNDHDPVPLFHVFQARIPGQFGWDYLQRGPETWRVAITKLSHARLDTAGSSCCGGGCGGGA